MTDRSVGHPDFQRRLASRGEELSRLFSGLYHGDQAAYGRFLDMLFRLWQERPEALRPWTAPGRETPSGTGTAASWACSSMSAASPAP